MTRSPDFLQRICTALEVTPKKLARLIGADFKDMEPLLKGQPSMLADIDRDEVWINLYEFTGQRLAAIMAVRAEMERELRMARTRRAARLERFKSYHEKRNART